MIGASGATFRVMKVGSNEAIVRRLRAQYEWLWRRKYPVTVRVGGWYVDGDGEGYSMELLEPLPPSTPEARAVVVMDALEPIWDEAPLSRPGWRPDQAPGFAELEGWTDLAAWFRELTIVSAFYAGTHGDATLENVMRRPATGEVVLIDPVPDIVIDRKVPRPDCKIFPRSSARSGGSTRRCSMSSRRGPRRSRSGGSRAGAAPSTSRSSCLIRRPTTAPAG